jgi:hypothetical protein
MIFIFKFHNYNLDLQLSEHYDKFLRSVFVGGFCEI